MRTCRQLQSSTVHVWLHSLRKDKATPPKDTDKFMDCFLLLARCAALKAVLGITVCARMLEFPCPRSTAMVRQSRLVEIFKKFF
ncbi:hypothetical protein DPMN_048312 [Dreissena polymorpha]|uniref:Uncharacterized protein n=1 Tax=Dreissena polymorpha TaxID=45954 RepID=A0A9D4DAF7_DREPO|nr:hypothetical protein DPMN_048312 [Dreissena polymorpha]